MSKKGLNVHVAVRLTLNLNEKVQAGGLNEILLGNMRLIARQRD